MSIPHIHPSVLTFALCSISLCFHIPVFSLGIILLYSLLWSFHPSYLLYRSLLPPPGVPAIKSLFLLFYSLALYLRFLHLSCLPTDLLPSPLIILFLSKYQSSFQTSLHLLACHQAALIIPSSFRSPSSPPTLPPSLAGSWPPSSLWSSLQSWGHLFLQENQVHASPPNASQDVCVFMRVCQFICMFVKVWPQIPLWASVKKKKKIGECCIFMTLRVE